MINKTINEKITESGTQVVINKLLLLLERQQKTQEWANDSIVNVRYESPDIEGQDTSVFNIGHIEKCLVGWNIATNQKNNLWFSSSQHSEPWTKTFIHDIKMSIDEIITLSYANSISNKHILGILNCKPELQRDIEEELELHVIRQYLLVPQVMRIYTDEYQQRKRFLIFTSNNTYDDSLMEFLLSIEHSIRLAFTSIPASFEYIPHLADVTNEIVPRVTKLIYQRGYDVFLTGAYVASWAQREVSKAAIR